MTIKHNDFVNEWLQDLESQNIYLRDSLLEFSEDGDYTEFFRPLKQVIKARTSVKQFAESIGMHRTNLVDLLHGRTKAPTIATINKILDGLEYEIKIQLKSAQDKLLILLVISFNIAIVQFLIYSLHLGNFWSEKYFIYLQRGNKEYFYNGIAKSYI